MASDAHHISAPNPEGQAAAVREAVQDAGMQEPGHGQAAAFDEHPAPRSADGLQGCVQLLAAIAPVGSQGVAGEAFGMQSHQWELAVVCRHVAQGEGHMIRAAAIPVAQQGEVPMPRGEVAGHDPGDIWRFLGGPGFERHGPSLCAWCFTATSARIYVR